MFGQSDRMKASTWTFMRIEPSPVTSTAVVDGPVIWQSTFVVSLKPVRACVESAKFVIVLGQNVYSKPKAGSNCISARIVLILGAGRPYSGLTAASSRFMMVFFPILGCLPPGL
jgi:hypothetical protein